MTPTRTDFNTMFGVIVLLLLAVSGSISGPTTPIIYIFYGNTLLTWYQAAQYCLDQNGTLAKIPNEMVASVLSESFQDIYAWIGLHKPAAGDYRWMDGLSLGDYQPWYRNKDYGEGDMCVRVNALYELEWKALNCTKRRRFICETSGGPQVPVPKPFVTKRCQECNFTMYEAKLPSKRPSSRSFEHTENCCKRACLSYYSNSEECIGYIYTGPYVTDNCHLYAGANLSVQLPMVNGSGIIGVKTCYSVQESSDIIIQENTAPVIFPNCEETSTSSIVYETTENAKVSMTMKSASSVMENGQATISATIVDKIGISTTTVDASITTADNSLESSSQDNLPMATDSERAAISTTTVEVVSLSATSVDDVLTTTAENNLESSSQDVSMTTETSAMLDDNLKLVATMCSCPCPRSLSINISITKEEIVKALLVKTTTLSSFRRKKESAKDDRPSAQAVGELGVALLAAVGVIILLFDADVLIKFVKARLNPRKRLFI